MGESASLGLNIASAASSAIGQYRQANAVTAQGEAAASVALENAAMARAQGTDATTRGAYTESLVRQGTRQLVGQQRTALAAQGVDVGSGTALDVQSSTAYLGELDALMARNNAAREAWGFEVEASNYTTQANAARSQAAGMAGGLKAGAFNTLLTGAIDSYGKYRSAHPALAPSDPSMPALPRLAPRLSGASAPTENPALSPRYASSPKGSVSRGYKGR